MALCPTAVCNKVQIDKASTEADVVQMTDCVDVQGNLETQYTHLSKSLFCLVNVSLGYLIAACNFKL